MLVMKLACTPLVHTTTLVVLLGLLLAGRVTASAEDKDQDKRQFSLFNIVRFTNDVCVANNLNGTCYTADECSTKGGVTGGTCGGGFGVCCTFSLSCGQSAAENNTNLIETTTTALLGTTCQYTICKSAASICRIKYDFKDLVLAPPVPGTAAAAPATGTNGGAIGDCVDDTFSIGGAKSSPPTICGLNTGQHMIVDAATNGCNTVTITLGSVTTTTRSWNIVVSQYTCSQEDLAGPPGCLQYHTAATGRIASFGFFNTATAAAVAGDSVTHLSNQAYDICIRRVLGKCIICYIPSLAGTSMSGSQDTYGLDVSSAAAAAKSQVGTDCVGDYIQINGAMSQTLASATMFTTVTSVGRHCGRFFATDAMAVAATGLASVCTRAQPFTVTVNFDADEMLVITDFTTDELAGFPSGIIGFDLTYAQSTATSC